MRGRLILTALGMALVLFSWLPAGADRTGEVESLLKSKIDEVMLLLSSADMPEALKRERIMAIISPFIDFELMARLTLGRQHWGSLTADQQTRFVDLFVNRLKNSYLDKTSLYSDQEVAYDTAATDKDKVSIPTRILTADKPVSVIYRFYPSQETWKVYDIEIEGVSFVRSYRTQFNEVLRGGTVDDLFAALEKPVEE